MHDRMADALRLRHRPDAPVRRVGRRRVQRGVNDGRDLIGRQGLPPARSRRVLQQPDDARLLKPTAPEVHGRPADAKLSRDGIHRRAVARREHDRGAGGDALRSLSTTDQRLEIGALRRRKRQRIGRLPHGRQHTRHQPYCKDINVTLH